MCNSFIRSLYLQSRMGIELIEKIHEQVYFECADTQHDVFLRLRSVAAVIASGLLSLHPQVDQLLELTQKQAEQNSKKPKKTHC